MSTMCLAEELNIKNTERSTLARQVNFMLMVQKEKNLRDEYVSKIYEEWVQVATRLKKGESMLIEALNKHTAEALSQDKRYNNLVNLYQFLMVVLGFYDDFFRLSLSQSHYESMKATILEIMTE